MADSTGDKQDEHRPQQGDWRTLHVWQIQPVRDVLLLIALLALVYLGYLLSVVTVPMLLAMALAYLFEPLVRLLTRAGRGPLTRPIAAVTIIVSVVLLIAVPLTLAVGYGVLQGSSVVRTIANNTGIIVSSADHPEDEALDSKAKQLGPRWIKLRDGIAHVRAQAARAKAQSAGQAPDGGNAAGPASGSERAEGPNSPGASSSGQVDIIAAQVYTGLEYATEWAKTNAASLSRQALTTGTGVVAFAIGVLGSIGYLVFSGFLTAFFFFFFCSSWGRVLEFWKSLIPERQKAPAIELLREMDTVIAGFIRGRLTICGITMAYFTTAYTIIGIPAPLILGPLVGLLSLAPYAATLGMVAVIVLKFLDPESVGFTGTWYWCVGAPIVVHLIQQGLDDYFLTPTIQGKSTNMDTPTILFASLAGGVLAGFYGLLIAIPVAACIKIVLRRLVFPRLQAWARGDARDPLPIR